MSAIPGRGTVAFVAHEVREYPFPERVARTVRRLCEIEACHGRREVAVGRG